MSNYNNERLIELEARLAEAEALRKRRRDEVVSAYIQGANDVHANWREDKAPDFTEAAMDYALSIDASQEG